MAPGDVEQLIEQRRRDVAMMKGQIKSLSKSLNALQEAHTELSEKIEPLLKDLEDMVQLLRNATAAFKFFAFIGKLAKPTAAIGGLIVAVMAWWQKFKS